MKISINENTLRKIISESMQSVLRTLSGDEREMLYNRWKERKAKEKEAMDSLASKYFEMKRQAKNSSTNSQSKSNKDKTTKKK